MRIIVTIGCIGAVLFFVSGFTSSMQKEPLYKNLQVLPKDISKKALDSTMDAFEAALGVNCKYCHVQDKQTRDSAFDRDDKAEKLIARKMMLMTQGINDKYFSDSSGYKTITCYSCHHGQPIPPKDSASAASRH